MAYVPGCRYDLFISYDSTNNREGWIEQFEEGLGGELADLLGRQFDPKESIFLDKRKLRIGNFPDQLAAAARGSAMLIPILSPGYLGSEWCNREWTEFFSSPPDGAPPKSLAPVLFRPIKEFEKELDPLLRDAQTLSFVGVDGQTPFPARSPEWIAQLRKFAGELKTALHELRQRCKPLFIGMAGPADRSQSLRSWCCRELEARHFQTVPPVTRAEPLPYLQKAGLALHFLGGADDVARQAMEESPGACKGPTILYQPFGAKLTPNEDFWLRTFEDQLQADPGRYQRLEGKNDQELLALIDDQITRSRASSAPDRRQLEVALVCEEIDLEAVRQMRDDIRARDAIEVDFPHFLGTRLNAMDCLRKLQAFLKSGEHAVFYHGSAKRESLECKWRVAEQHFPTSALHWFVAPPDLEGKRQRYAHDLWNIDQVISLVRQAQSAGQS